MRRVTPRKGVIPSRSRTERRDEARGWQIMLWPRRYRCRFPPRWRGAVDERAVASVQTAIRWRGSGGTAACAPEGGPIRSARAAVRTSVHAVIPVLPRQRSVRSARTAAAPEMAPFNTVEQCMATWRVGPVMRVPAWPHRTRYRLRLAAVAISAGAPRPVDRTSTALTRGSVASKAFARSVPAFERCR
jgi:hypothetical protein